MKKSLITGVTGQDGFYLSKLLLSKGHKVFGVKRRNSLINATARIDKLLANKNFIIIQGDMSDPFFLNNTICKIKPDYIFNLAAMSHVKTSFDIPEYTTDVNSLGTLRILEVLRTNNLLKTKFYQASSSEIFGNSQKKTQNEKTEIAPASPYAATKAYSYWITKIYRESYKLFACNGILFNHESPYRGETFVTRKIIRAAVRIKHNLEKKLTLGNLNSIRDWGHAEDYCEAMIKILNYSKADDFVISSNNSISVREFTIRAFRKLGIILEFKNKGLNEVGFVKDIVSSSISHLKKSQIIVNVDKKYFRPTDVEYLKGDFSKAAKLLKWKPKKTLNDLINEMINFEETQIK